MTSDDIGPEATKLVDAHAFGRPAAASAGRRVVVLGTAVAAALLVVAGILYATLADPVVPLVTRAPLQSSGTVPAVAPAVTPSPVVTVAASDGAPSQNAGGSATSRQTPATVGPTDRTDTTTSVTRPPALPIAPTILTAERVGNYEMAVSWTDNSTGELRFDVELNGEVIGTAPPNDYSYWIPVPIIDEVSVEYCFRVRAVGPWGADQTEQPTAWTSRACAFSVPNPATPSEVRVIPISDTAIRIAWVDNSAIETGFAIVRTPGLIEKTVGPNVTSLIWDGLPPGTQFCFSVRAANSLNYDNLGDCAWTHRASTGG